MKVIPKYINVKKVHDGLDFLIELREQFRKFVEEYGYSIQQAVKEISEIYGIPHVDLEYILSDMIDEYKTMRR